MPAEIGYGVKSLMHKARSMARGTMHPDGLVPPYFYGPKEGLVPMVAKPKAIEKSSGILSGVAGVVGMMGTGAAIGAGSAYMSGGNVGAGAVYGSALGLGGGAFGRSATISNNLIKASTYAMDKGMPSLSHAAASAGIGSNKFGGAIGATIGGMVGGIGFSGNRGQNKSRGLNSARGNRINSGRY